MDMSEHITPKNACLRWFWQKMKSWWGKDTHHHIWFWYLWCCCCPGLRGRQHLAKPHTRSPWIPV